ncbi:MAG: DUF1800 family protein [Puniceicoccaceae bacterium]
MLTPETAWEPLPKEEWTIETARHLAVRLGFSVNPALVAKVYEWGPEVSLQKLLGKIEPLTDRGEVAAMRESMGERYQELQGSNPAKKREMRQMLQKENRQSYAQYGLDWYAFAREPGHSAQEKLVLFFQDVWVVAFSGVRRTPTLMDYQDRIRRNLGRTYPEMCRDLAISPAMLRYLNLNQSRKGSPNENFARELFELFCLGEGQYTEEDIKEAARAMTGWTVNQMDEVRFVRQRHDTSRKKLFGETGTFELDDVIELVFKQPAAARFLPNELARFYLTDDGLGDRILEPLAENWRASGFSLPYLVMTFFRSRVFYEPGFRGNMIKSPVQYYLGLLQDLDLDVFPSPRRTNNILRTMGQPFYNPPNVRGWVGGRNWINSATLAARRQFVESLLRPLPANRLNADEEEAIAEAEAAGRAQFTVDQGQLQKLAEMAPDQLAGALANRFHVSPRPETLLPMFQELQSTQAGPRWAAACLAATLTAPPYHLC